MNSLEYPPSDTDAGLYSLPVVYTLGNPC